MAKRTMASQTRVVDLVRIVGELVGQACSGKQGVHTLFVSVRPVVSSGALHLAERGGSTNIGMLRFGSDPLHSVQNSLKALYQVMPGLFANRLP